MSTEVGLVIAYDDRYRHMIWFGTEARNSGLEEIARVNIGHISFGIDGSGKRHGVRGIYCGGIPEVFTTQACEQIVAVNQIFCGEQIQGQQRDCLVNKRKDRHRYESAVKGRLNCFSHRFLAILVIDGSNLSNQVGAA